MCTGCFEEGFVLVSGGLQPKLKGLKCGCSICKPEPSGEDSFCWSCNHHFRKT